MEDKKQSKSRLADTSYDHGSIGVVPNEDRRATKKEPEFTGLSRESIQDRFNSAESTPTTGPTVPTTRSPEIIEQIAPNPKSLQLPQQQPADTYHQHTHTPVGEDEDEDTEAESILNSALKKALERRLQNDD